MTKRPRLVVVGSSNTDLTVVADRLPAPGETVLGQDLRRAGGGKGANQAVAAARAGADVTFVARVGADDFGQAALASLRREGIGTDYVRVDEQAPSGVALIIVDRAGENLIAVASGVNSRLCPEDVRGARRAVEAADLMLLQLEVPEGTVRAAMALARASGVPVLLNPAPAQEWAAGLLAGLDYVAPNRREAAQLLGLSPGHPPADMARRLVAAGVRAAVVTAGPEGACTYDGADSCIVSAPRVDAVDTVGAGDCFCGALAVALAGNLPLRAAARFAVYAAALSVQTAGAQPSMPTRDQIERFLSAHSSGDSA